MSDNLKYYFDYAAATPLLPTAKLAMSPYLNSQFYNASAIYLGGQANRLALEQARHTIAQGVGAQPTEIIFTAGGTEANNLAIRGIMEAFENGQVVTCTIEHDSVLAPVKLFNHRIIPVNDRGIVQPSDLKKVINDETVLVSIMYANHEIGAIQPIQEISAMIRIIKQDRLKRQINRPLYFHTDACQASNYLDMQVVRLGVDLMTLNAGKIYGPKQTGALYVRKGINLRPLIMGGGQEWNKRSGTENLANIIGFAAAWQSVRADYHNEANRLMNLRDQLVLSLKHSLPSTIINGPMNHKRLPNNINLTIPGYDNERILMALDEIGMQVATGSACAANTSETSHVLRAIGLSDELASNSLRISLGRFSTIESIQKLVAAMVKICK